MSSGPVRSQSDTPSLILNLEEVKGLRGGDCPGQLQQHGVQAGVQ